MLCKLEDAVHTTVAVKHERGSRLVLRGSRVTVTEHSCVLMLRLGVVRHTCHGLHLLLTCGLALSGVGGGVGGVISISEVYGLRTTCNTVGHMGYVDLVEVVHVALDLERRVVASSSAADFVVANMHAANGYHGASVVSQPVFGSKIHVVRVHV